MQLSKFTKKQWRHYGAGDRPGWHPPGGDTRRKKICGWIYKEQWTNEVGPVKKVRDDTLKGVKPEWMQ